MKSNASTKHAEASEGPEPVGGDGDVDDMPMMACGGPVKMAGGGKVRGMGIATRGGKYKTC